MRLREDDQINNAAILSIVEQKLLEKLLMNGLKRCQINPLIPEVDFHQ